MFVDSIFIGHKVAFTLRKITKNMAQYQTYNNHYLCSHPLEQTHIYQ